MTMAATASFQTRKAGGLPGACIMPVLALVACFLSGCASAPAIRQNAFVPLVSHLAERVKTADQVALSKWDSGRPVHDPQREADVIARAVAAAPAYGLSTQDVEAFFADQIEASKQVQHALLDLWRRSGSAPAWPRRSLSDEIRPQLDSLQVEIMQDLQQLRLQRQVAACEADVARAVAHVTRVAALEGVHRAALDRAVGRVCIGD